ncbi:auxin-responsive protein SAUR32-like [Musa acuminata AAA Group]|uniref:auxin-responsive protein SAUR32-like n=1 Tax=Musa acuminata AAA Group TaxID=214697 RepID=UPI0031CF9113
MGKPLAPLAEEPKATEKTTSQLIPYCGEEMQEDKKTKVKKGSLTVRVGLEDGEDGGGTRKFVIPISYLYHPLFKRLLESAQEVYGYHSSGPLKLPCSVDDFLHLRWLIERESSHRSHHGVHHSFSLHSC